MLVNQGLGKYSKGDCRPKTPALWGFPPPDGGRCDASSGRAWARRFMGDDEVPQLTLDSSPLCMIFPDRFFAILYIWLKILNREKSPKKTKTVKILSKRASETFGSILRFRVVDRSVWGEAIECYLRPVFRWCFWKSSATWSKNKNYRFDWWKFPVCRYTGGSVLWIMYRLLSSDQKKREQSLGWDNTG